MQVTRLWIYDTPQRLLPAFLVPQEWLSGWGEHGFEHVFRFSIPQEVPFRPSVEPVDIMRTLPVVTVQIVKAYRNEVPVPHVLLLGGGRWLVGHPKVKELAHAVDAPV